MNETMTHLTVDKVKRYRIVHRRVGRYRAGEIATREQLISAVRDVMEEQKKSAIREGIERLLDLGAITPVPDEGE